MTTIAVLIILCSTWMIGSIMGWNTGQDVMRNKVVLYCIEKPQLCKEEYQNIKTQNKINDYQKPEIK
jgi:hypothetical protein